MMFLASVRNWLARLLWRVRPGVVSERPLGPVGAMECRFYRSISSPMYGMIVYRMPDGKLYPHRSAVQILQSLPEPWEPTEDFKLESTKQLHPVEDSQSEQGTIQNEAKSS